MSTTCTSPLFYSPFDNTVVQGVVQVLQLKSTRTTRKTRTSRKTWKVFNFKSRVDVHLSRIFVRIIVWRCEVNLKSIIVNRNKINIELACIIQKLTKTTIAESFERHLG